MFSGLSERFQDIFSGFSSSKVFTEENLTDAVKQVRLALLDADVNFKVASTLVKKIKVKVLGSETQKGVKTSDAFIDIVHKELVELMGEGESSISIKKKPTKILLCGLQGSGKTTTSVKLSKYFLEMGKTPHLVALDLQRPAAIKQLEILAESISVDVFSDLDEKNPLEVAKNSLSLCSDVIIYDTAGRQNLDDALMKELSSLKEIIEPDYVFFVANCGSGQQAVITAKAFEEKIGITGSILTMLDGSARAGAAISIKEVTGKPLYFEGVGEKITDLQVFHPKSMADRILGMGDVINLVKKMKKEISDEESEEMEKKIRKATFTYDDFLKQMKMLKNMGSFKGIFKMMPGMGGNMPDFSQGEKQFKTFQAVIHSMTPKERSLSDDLTMGRKKRLAKGAGMSLGEVNKLIKKFKQMKQMAKQLPAMEKSFSKFDDKKHPFKRP